MAKPRAKPKAKSKSPTGRPSRYLKAHDAQAYDLSLLGATEEQIARAFGVTRPTIDNWKLKHASFLGALKAGKDPADAGVGKSLYQRAMGYTCKETKVFMHEGEPVTVEIDKHYPPDVTACIFWLKNRQKEQWRDKQDMEHTGPGGGPLDFMHRIIDQIDGQTRDLTPAGRGVATNGRGNGASSQ